MRCFRTRHFLLAQVLEQVERVSPQFVHGGIGLGRLCYVYRRGKAFRFLRLQYHLGVVKAFLHGICELAKDLLERRAVPSVKVGGSNLLGEGDFGLLEGREQSDVTSE